ncbi:MAG TPA: ATP-binding protein [Allosphingosinicella sp.]|nr:ATP-binding protein [Allosphingosinicella sp.]
MSIADLSEAEFVSILQRHLSPSSPINELQLLKGRADQVEQIRRAFHSPGRQVFIHGDRGVGKSSLAITMGNYLCGDARRPVQVACNGQTFFSLIRDIGNQLLNFTPASPSRLSRGSVGVQSFGISATLESQLQTRAVPELSSLNEALSVIRYCADLSFEEPVIIVDEFDKISGPEDREMFADFIKQLGDQRVPVKVFFTGIGQSLDGLLADHHSCYRYLASVHLKPLPWQGRLDIIDDAAFALGIEVDPASRFRIGALSDGFPHYIHLVCEKLFWRAFDDESQVKATTPDMYIDAVHDAVRDIEPTLEKLYEEATQKYNDDYQSVLWAVADHHEFKRRSVDIYTSYCDIMAQKGSEPLDRTKFNARMAYLKQPSHGEILIGSRQGWYELREPILRGYIRLRAEAEGIELAQDHPQQEGARRLRLYGQAKLPGV